MLTRYIPTETVTLYVAAMAPLGEFAKDRAGWGDGPALATYAVFAIVTPLLLLLLTLAEYRKAGDPSPFKLP